MLFQVHTKPATGKATMDELHKIINGRFKGQSGIKHKLQYSRFLRNGFTSTHSDGKVWVGSVINFTWQGITTYQYHP